MGPGSLAAVRPLAVLAGSALAVFGFLAIAVLGLGLGAAAVDALGGGLALRRVGSLLLSVGLSVGWVVLVSRGWRRLRDAG